MATAAGVSDGNHDPSEGGEDEKHDTNHVAIPRHLGLFDCIWHLTGVVIGTGIFISPTGVLRGSGGSVGISFILWIVCAIINVCGALTLAELSVIMKKSGGDFVFLLQAYGPLIAFIRLWVLSVIIFPIGLAVTSLTISKYVLTPFFQCVEAPVLSARLIAICCLLFFTAVNCISVRLVSKFAGILSIMKLVGLSVIIVSGLYYLATGHTEHLENVFEGSKSYDIALLPVGLLSGIWAYSGWSISTSITEEIKNPARNIPLAIVISMSVITGVYFLANIAYLTLLSPDDILNSDAVAADYSVLALGPRWSWTIWMFVAMSAMGSLNGGLFKSARIIFSAAREGHYPEIFSMVSIRRRTPLPAILVCLLSFIFLLEDDVIVLVGYLGFADVVFETFTVSVVPYYRWKHPDMPRPFKVPIVIAVLYLATLVFIAVMSIYADPINKSIGLVIALTAVPIYFLCVHPRFKLKCVESTSGTITRFLQKVFFCIRQEKRTF